MNKLPGVMIRAGLILLVFGIFRRTTVDTGWGEIHNIGLMQQQTNLILVGAVIFIGGLILKSKKSDDSMISKEDDDVTKSSGLVSRRLNDSKTKVTEISQKLSALSTRVLDRMSEFRDRFFPKVGIGIWRITFINRLVTDVCTSFARFVSIAVDTFNAPY